MAITDNPVLDKVIPKVTTAQILHGVIIFLVIVIALSLMALIVWYFVRKKKYSQYKVEIFDKDSNGNVYKSYDRAGVFLDKRTNLKLLFLEKAKVGMNPNNPPYVSHLDNKGRLIKTIYLRKIGVNNYVFIEVDLIGKPQFTMGEEDYNNAAQEMAKIRRTYDKKSWLDKYLAPAIFIIVVFITMIIILSLFNKFSEIKEVSQNMLAVTMLQTDITEMLLNITNSTQQANTPGYATIIRPTDMGGG